MPASAAYSRQYQGVSPERPPSVPLTRSCLGDWVVRACPDGLWVWDEDGRTVFANERMAEMLGLDHASIVGFSAFDAMDEAGRQDLRRHLDQLRDTGRDGNDLDCQFQRPDGTHVWALVSHAPLIDDDGVHRGWLHRASEHSLQHQRLVELERREKLFEEAQHIASIANWDWDLPTDIVWWSDEMFHIYGLDPEAFRPSIDNFFDRVYVDDVAHVQESIALALAGQEGDDPVTYDYRFAPDVGELRWMRTRAVAYRDEAGAPVRLAGTSQDVTESKENENGLAFLGAIAGAANEAQRLEDVLQSADATIRPYIEWPVVVISTPEHPGGDDLVHLDVEWEPASEELRAAARGLAERIGRERGVIQQLGPTGTLLLGGAVAVGDRLACVLVCDTRRTSLRPSDVMLLRQMITMLASVAQREWAAEELATARDQALHASRAKSEFLATMSHEIRTPLNGVIGLSELLGSTELTPHQQRLAAGVDQAGRTLLALINDILDLSKIEAGRLELEEVDFDPRTIIEQSVGLVADQARTKHLELLVSSAADMPEQVRGDPVRFGQVITNLAANAIKFTSAGEVVVRATGGHGPDGTVVRVEVTDTGVGIAPDVEDRLFKPFSQADSSTTREYGGTGLGLAISKRIVTAMGGEIGVVSQPGVGSTFWFTVALAAPAQDGPGRDDEREGAVSGLRVLIVDDNETNRFILTEKLTAWHVDVTAVVSAYEALVELDAATRREASYDVVLLDYMMPGADGEQLARIIRAESRHDRTRLALLSSAMEPSDNFLSDAGIDMFLSKPVLASQLLDTLATLGGRFDPDQDRTEPVVDPSGTVTLGRILVVEDNPVNQMVAEGVLRRIGYTVVVADNGAAGVATFAEEPKGFDAILMDCQMPVMNGYDATHAIRSMQSVGPRIPIIAMTAAAGSEERQRCLNAGMDDFLLKPVDRALLARTLARWIPDSEDRTDPPTPGATPVLASCDEPDGPPDGPPGGRLRVLDRSRLSDMLEDGDADLALVLRIVNRFEGRARDAVTEMTAALERGDHGGLSQLAHGLRGGAANVGLLQLAGLCTDIELSAEGGLLPESSALDDVATGVAAGVSQLERLAADLVRRTATTPASARLR